MKQLEIHRNLNKEQLKIIEETKGIVRVISGPGTGKSTTCVHYIAEIINSQRAKAENILGVTFTNKAAKELKERVVKMVGKSPDISTIHSFCALVLRKNPPPGYTENFTIIDQGGQFITVGNLIKQLGLGVHPRFVLEKLTLARNLRDISILKDEELEDFYKTYMTSLQARDMIDYDGLLTWCFSILDKSPQMLEYFSDQYKYILVDEFQDISPIQLDIIKLLVEKNKNLIAVGDPDQSIYRFRGADVGIMVHLDQVFPEIKTFYLSQNYRSSEKIIKAATNLIQNNKQRLIKPLWTKRGQGEDPEVIPVENETKEAEYIAAYIQAMVKKDQLYNDFAVLYRVNYLGTEFETLFSKMEIPYQIVGGFGYYQNVEIMNIVSFFKLVKEPKDNEAFLRACSVIAQVEGKSIRNFKNRFSADTGFSLIDVAYQAQESLIQQLPDFINGLSKEKSLVDIYNLVLEKTSYLEHLRKDNSTPGERRVDNLEQLKSILVKLEESGKGLNEFLEMVEKVVEDQDENSVKLMTVHGAKGLEFDTVFIAGAEKGMFPHFKAESPEDFEEERRLFYVAITRAKNKLIITYPKERLVKGEKVKRIPAIFTDELQLKKGWAGYASARFKKNLDPMVTGIKHGKVDKEEIKEGSRVYHPSFGRGKVININKSTSQTLVAIDFSNEMKTLILEYSPLKVEE